MTKPKTNPRRQQKGPGWAKREKAGDMGNPVAKARCMKRRPSSRRQRHLPGWTSEGCDGGPRERLAGMPIFACNLYYMYVHVY